MIWHSTQYPGVRFREHESRKFRGKPDRYFSIRYKRDGKTKEESCGWLSEGITAAMAAEIRSEIVSNIRTGTGFQSLADRRQEQTDKRTAIAEAAEREAKENITFGACAAEFLKWSAANKKSHAADESRYREHLMIFADVPMKNISPFDVEKLKRTLLKKGLAQATILQVLGLIRSVFHKARKWKLYAGECPTDSVDMPKPDNKRIRFLSHQEARQLLDALKEKSLQTWCQAGLALYCGLRFSEIASLTVGKTDMQNGILHITDTKTGVPRQAYITEPVREILDLALQHCEGKGPDALLFPQYDGKKQKRISPTFGRVVAAIGLNAGVTDPREKVCFHTLRHTFASWLAIQGESLFVIQQLLGHANIEMTQRYAHLIPDVKQDAVSSLAASFADSGEKVVRFRKKG